MIGGFPFFAHPVMITSASNLILGGNRRNRCKVEVNSGTLIRSTPDSMSVFRDGFLANVSED